MSISMLRNILILHDLPEGIPKEEPAGLLAQWFCHLSAVFVSLALEL